MQCQIENGQPSFQPFIVDYYEDGIARIECSVGHKTAHLVQSPKFEILMESGATALLEGFTLEACASFSAALERFYEFALRVVCSARGMSTELYTKMFAEMARQSERQLGAFMLLYAVEFGEAYKENPKVREFRNSVIHKGMIPTAEKASEFASNIYYIIFSLYRKLNDKHANHIMATIMQNLAERRATLPSDMPVATNSATMFFNAAKTDIKPDFAKALTDFKKARQMIVGTVSHMQVLHDLLKSGGH